jgi:hypothetical protein
MITLEQIEARIREFVEIRLSAILPGRTLESFVIHQFAEAMHANAIVKEGKRYAPNVYTLISRPDQVTSWQDPQWVDALKDTIYTAGREAGLDFVTQPTLTISTDASLALNQIRIVASHKVETIAETNNMPQSDAGEEGDDHLPDNAFLIVDGRKVFPLKETVINIGRRLENNLVLDDPRISRNHSQLRAIKGRFVIFDLNSTGGTFVNGQRIQQTVLYPGDVVSLAGVTLVFGQDNPPPRPDLRETGPLPIQSAERPTAILKDRTDIRKKRK